MDTTLLSGRWARASLVGLCASVLMTSLEVRAQVMTDTRPIVPIVLGGSYLGRTPAEVCKQYLPYEINYISTGLGLTDPFNFRIRIDSWQPPSTLLNTVRPYNAPRFGGWKGTTLFDYWRNDTSYTPPRRELVSGAWMRGYWIYPICPYNPIVGSYPLEAPNPPQYCPSPVRDPSCPVNNPGEAASGTKVHSEVDIQTFGPQPVSLVRYYRSSYDVPASFVGANWQTNWHRRLDFSLSQEGVRVAAVQPDGRLKLYYESNGQFVSEPGVYDQLSKETQTNSDGAVSTIGYRLLIAETDATERYDTSGKLLSVTERNGWVTTLYVPQIEDVMTLFERLQADFPGEEMKNFSLAQLKEKILEDILSKIFT